MLWAYFTARSNKVVDVQCDEFDSLESEVSTGDIQIVQGLVERRLGHGETISKFSSLEPCALCSLETYRRRLGIQPCSIRNTLRRRDLSG